MRFTRVLVVALLLSPAAHAQGPRKPSAPGFAPTAPVLTKQDVEKMIVVIPELAKESGNMQQAPVNAMGAIGQGGPPGNMPIEDIERVEKLLQKYGYTFPEFFMKLTTLLSTYLSLKPDEFDKQLPTESTPEIKRVLEDPSVTEAQKKAIREQLSVTQKNKEAIRAQLLQLATDENKKVVKPMLRRVEVALKHAEELSRQARAEALQKSKQGPRKPPP